MAPRLRVNGQREAVKPLTRADLKELVQALGALVRESVAKEVAPLTAAVEALRRTMRDSADKGQNIAASNAAMTGAREEELRLMRISSDEQRRERVPTVTNVDHETRGITIGLREHVDGEVVPKRERGGMLGP